MLMHRICNWSGPDIMAHTEKKTLLLTKQTQDVVNQKLFEDIEIHTIFIDK